MSLISNGGGITMIHALQRLPIPGGHALFTGLSFLGEEKFFLILLPVLLWVVDWRLGVRATLGFLLSVYLNDVLKDLWRQPRPFVLDPTISHPTVVGYGMPSGHAQSAVVVWGLIALTTRRPWIRAACVLLIGLIGLSRVALGVHLPSQVLAGWAVGAILLAFCVGALPHLERSWRALPRVGQMVAALAVPIVLALIHLDGDTAGSMGVLAGLGAGLSVDPGPRDVGATARRNGLRLLAGLGLLFALYLGLSALLPKSGAPLYEPLRFVRYAVVGLWVSLGAPRLFARLGWAPDVRAGEHPGEAVFRQE